MNTPQRIVVIRRDNIGDLICTTPLIAALRQHYPHAHLAALVNSYNAPVLAHNPDLDEVRSYTKVKHRAPGEGRLGVLARRLQTLRELRAQRYDLALLAAPGNQRRALSLARTIRARRIIGFREPGAEALPGLDTAVEADNPQAALHEVQRVFKLLTALGIDGAPGPLRLAVEPRLAASAAERLRASGLGAGGAPIGIHVSARDRNRWPEAHFIALIRHLWTTHGRPFVLFWAPGPEHDRRHPGDDERAGRIRAGLGDIPVLNYPTARLEELFAGLDLCSHVICCDGGALHVAAALGKPVVGLYRPSQVGRWYPWGVRHETVIADGDRIASIPVEAVANACDRLLPGDRSPSAAQARRE